MARTKRSFAKATVVQVACLLLCSTMCSPLHAAFAFVFDQGSYMAAVNTKVDISIYLEATGAERDFLLASSAGRVYALGVRVNNDNPAIGANVVANADISPNTTIFDDPIITPVIDRGVGFARVAAFTNNPNGVALPAPIPNTDPVRVRLATISYTTGAATNVMTTLSFADFDGSVNIAASDGAGGAIALDSLVNFSNTAQITSVAAVPEPGSLLLASLATFGMLGRFMCVRIWSAVAAS